MLSLMGTIRVFVAVPPADLRKGYDGLARLAREVIAQDPLSGHLFVFANGDGTGSRSSTGIATATPSG